MIWELFMNNGLKFQKIQEGIIDNFKSIIGASLIKVKQTL